MRPFFFWVIVKIPVTSLVGLDLLASAIVILDRDGFIAYANAAAETMLESSFKSLKTQRLFDLFTNGEELESIFQEAVERQFADKRQDLTLERSGRDQLQIHVAVTALDNPDSPVLIEMRENVQQLKLDREERLLDQSLANKELIRNLAHEIKNPPVE